MEFEWIIHQKEFNQYKNAEWLLSDHFADGSMGFCFAPKGPKYLPDAIFFGLQFYKFPKSVHKVSFGTELRTNFSINYNDVLFTEDRTYYVEYGRMMFVSMNPGWSQGIIQTEMDRLHELRFHIKITIETVECKGALDYGGVDSWVGKGKTNTVDRTEWGNYGIMTNSD